MNTSKIRIELSNFRAINYANILINGITVVAGENGSGKSSLSKFLYYSYKTTCNYEPVVLNSLRKNFFKIEHFFRILLNELEQVSISKNLNEEYDSFQQLRNETRLNNLSFNLIDEWIDFVKRMENNLKVQVTTLINSKNPKYDRLIKRLELTLRDVLEESYNNDFTPITNYDALIKLVENWKTIAFEKIRTRPLDVFLGELKENLPQYNLPNTFGVYEDDVLLFSRNSSSVAESLFVQNTIYIDTPMMLGVDHYAESSYWDDLNEILHLPQKTFFNYNIDKISSDIINGEVELDETNVYDSNFIYSRSDGQKFDLLQSATGIKSFAMLQLLLKNGSLTNKTLFIIDEPEAHLHPQWIIEYARLIVLLNKEIGVNFFIASHSPDMVSAIRYISEKEGTLDGVNFYLAEQSNNNKYLYSYNSLGKDIEPIFASFNISIDRMDKYTL